MFHPEDASSLPAPSSLTPIDFHEEGGSSLTFSQASDDGFVARVNEAFDSASGKPFAKENLRWATRWLHFRGLIMSEVITGSESTLAQQIVRYLRNKVPHGFRLCMSDGNTVALKGVLLLVAIAHLYVVRIVIFSTRRKPVEISPDTGIVHHTVALLSHHDSILSVGGWYPLEMAKNWVKRIATVHMTLTPPMASPAAVWRPQGAAPKWKAPANYTSVSDDTLRDLLRSVM